MRLFLPLRMLRAACALAGCLTAAGALAPLGAQQPAPPPVDSILVEGNARLTAAQIAGTSGIVIGQTINYRDVQRAINSLFATGQFDDVTVEQRQRGGRFVLAIKVKERPLLERWAVRGPEKVSEGDVRERVKLLDGRPLDRAAVEQSRYAIDSLYRAKGYYDTDVEARLVPQPSGAVHLIFDIDEGDRLAVGQVVVEGNQRFTDKQLVKRMGTQPEGFWWFQKGEYDERELEDDLRERLPAWYADNGYLDFQVTRDTLIPDSAGGRAVLQVAVEEGPLYRIGSFEIEGNRRYSSEELRAMYPFAGAADGRPAPVFQAGAWNDATERVRNLYANTGYIYARVDAEELRRTLPDGTPVVDLKWQISEGLPATIRKVDIVGNDVTHERVIRESIVMIPGQVFNRQALIDSYRNVGNLGFFQQPMAPPDVRPVEGGQEVDIVFRVEERRTGNINFGASLGQGTGVGGFLGLEEPNLFGRGKRGKLQWQFGARLNDFTLSYTDPAIRESRISGTISLFDSRARYTIEDLGRRRSTGGSLQLGFPFLGARYTRIFTSYSLQRYKFTEGSEDIQEAFRCANCTRSTFGVSILRDTRFGLPFATGGVLTNVSGELNGGVLGGSGKFQKIEVEGRWYAPLGTMGGDGAFGQGVQFVLGLTAKSGWVFGDASNFFTELYTLGGVQFGLPLRGYDECSITPRGFDPAAAGGSCQAAAFGNSYASFTVEAGARISQQFYLSTFLDAGNVYRTTRQYDPTRLFRGAGFGVALISPLGPIGVDLGYGFDRVDAQGNPKPGWQLHFKVGNFF